MALVGNNPNAVADVWCTNGGSRYARPFRIIPDRGQIAEDDIEPPRPQRGDVFHEDVPGSKTANNPMEFGPQAGLLTADARPLARVANVLAREAAADEIDFVRFEWACWKLPDIFIPRG